MLDYEVFEVESCSGDADACLAGRFVGIWAGEVGAFVVHWFLWRDQSCASLTDERYVVGFDGQLFFVLAAFDDDAASAWCGRDGPLD